MSIAKAGLGALLATLVLGALAGVTAVLTGKLLAINAATFHARNGDLAFLSSWGIVGLVFVGSRYLQALFGWLAEHIAEGNVQGGYAPGLWGSLCWILQYLFFFFCRHAVAFGVVAAVVGVLMRGAASV